MSEKQQKPQSRYAEEQRRLQQSRRDRKKNSQRNNQVKQATQQVAISTKTSRAPVVRQQGTQITVTNDEQVGVIASTTSEFQMQFSGIINPGQTNMFPWLSGVATRYEKFRFTKFQVQYRAQTASTTSGFVSMYVDYDSSDPAATTSQLASNNLGAKEFQPWNNGQMSANPFQLKYIMIGQQPDMTDIHTYSPGTLYVASGANPTPGVRLGTIWLSYTVVLSKPQIELPIAQYAHLNATCVSQVPFAQIQYNKGFQQVIVLPDKQSIQLNGIGEYLLNVLWNTSSQLNNSAFPQIWQTDPYGVATNVISSFRNISTPSNLQQMFKITIKGLTQILFNNIAGAITGLDLRITNGKLSYDTTQP